MIETALGEAALWLMGLLLKISLFSLVAGVVTLPLFYLTLLYLNGWFWSVDEVSADARSSDIKPSFVKMIAAPLLVWILPVVSFACTLFLVSYFSGVKSSPADTKKEPSFGKTQFDEITRSIAQLLPKGAVDPKADLTPSQRAEEEIKFSLRGVRVLKMLVLLMAGPFPTLVILFSLIVGRKGIVLIFRSLSRNLLRTSLTYLAVFVLVAVVTSIWAVLDFLDFYTSEKESNLKAIVTEKNQIPSQMKPSHEAEFKALVRELPAHLQPRDLDEDMMTWAFVGGSLDPKNRTPQNSLFLFAMQPRKLLTMMDGLDELTGEQMDLLRRSVDMMEENRQAVIIGTEKLKLMDKKVGDKIKMTSFNYKEVDFDFLIAGSFPEGTRYDQSAVMHRDYLYKSLEEYEGKKGKHPLAEKCLNLIWIRMPSREAFEMLAEKVNSSGKFNPAVKMETASGAINSFMEPFKDLIWGMRRLLAPALLATMVLIISNAISISVRERRTEMAVLKVLGFRPWMVMALVLGEALMIGALSGFMATATTYALVNAFGGIPLPIAFFGKFTIPPAALWWGPAIGGGTALLGSIMPSLSARSVKVSEVFSRVA